MGRDVGRDGELVVVLANERARVAIDTVHGADITEFTVLPSGLDVVVSGPRGSRTLSADPDLAFIDGYHGGWQEVFPNGGAPSTWEGIRFGQHDEVWRRAWTVDRRSDSELALTVETQLLPFRLRKEIRLVAGTARLEVREVVTATGVRRCPAMWGQHLAYGPPFLSPGTRLALPDGVAVRPHLQAINPPHRLFAPGPGRYPLLPGPGGESVDLRELPGPGAASDIAYAGPFPDPAWYEVARPDGLTLRVEWGARALPYLWLWYELGATSGTPWYGTLVAIGLEPNSSWPTDGVAEAVVNGSALWFEPGQTLDSWYAVEVRPRGAAP